MARWRRVVVSPDTCENYWNFNENKGDVIDHVGSSDGQIVSPAIRVKSTLGANERNSIRINSPIDSPRVFFGTVPSLGAGSSGFTIAMHCNFTDLEESDITLMLALSTPSNWVFITYSPTTWTFDLKKSASSKTATFDTNSVLEENKWHRLMWVFDGTADNADILKLYVDGTPVSGSVDADFHTTFMSVIPSASYLGTTSTQTMQADVDNLTFWSSALSEADITKDVTKSLTKVRARFIPR